MELNKIYLGECLDVLKTFPDNSVDSVVTDPPYGIGFMGKEWDTFKKNYLVEKQISDLGRGPRPDGRKSVAFNRAGANKQKL